MLEELDVALPDEIIGPLPSLRGRHPALPDTASLVDRLEAGEDRCIVALGLQESAQTSDPVVGSDVREVNPEEVVEDGVVRRPDRVHILRQQQSPTTQAVRDVDVASYLHPGGWSRRVKIRAVRVAAGRGRCRVPAGLCGAGV